MKDHQRIHSSKSNEWYTPPIYIEAARIVLGGIDLDPASCREANGHIRAATYWTKEDDGLSRPWAGTVWLNPPYGKTNGKSNQYIWSQYLIDQYTKENIYAAILLVNACPGEKWFQPLWNYPICFTDHRIKFIAPDGTRNQPTHSNAFVCFGKTKRFEEHFSKFGHIVTPRNSY